MQIKAVTINAAGMMAAGRGAQENRNQIQPEGGIFGPEYRVTISREGRNLSGRQTAKPEADARSAQSAEKKRTLLRRQEEAESVMQDREGYREELNEIDEQIKALNASYTSWVEEIGKDREYEKDAMKSLMDKTVSDLKDLKKAMREQERFETEEAEKRMRAAQQTVMQRSARYQGEIDENNRNLAAFLKTMEEAEKAEDRREGDVTEEDSDASGTGRSTADTIKDSALQFMASSANREKNVEEMLTGISESGHFFLDRADTVTRNVLQKSADIRKALDSEDFTDEQIEEMMRKFRGEMELNYKDVKYCRSFGIDVLQNVRDAGIDHIAGESFKGAQRTKDGMMRLAVDAALGGARLSGLNEKSRELADEVEKLVDARNDIDKTPEEKEEEKRIQEELLQQEEEKEETIIDLVY